MPKKTLLVFDTDMRGHHADYIAYLIDYQQANASIGLIVVTDERLTNRFEGQYEGNKNLFFEGIPANEIVALHRNNIIRRSYEEWKLFCRFAKKYRPSHGLLMYFDVFQVGLIGTWSAPCSVSGVYFRPDFHYSTNGWKARLNAFRKKWMLKQILKKTFVKALFSLDKSAVEIISKFGGNTKVLSISDPVKSFELSPQSVNDLRESLGLMAGRKTFLLFGFLDDRKGIEKLISALDLLEESDFEQIQIIIAGAIEASYRQKIEVLLATLPTSVVIKTVFEEIKGADIQRYFAISDFVLALYQHHVGMSQILVRAAIAQKPLIASDFGLMGQIVNEKCLGITTDSSDPEAIATVIGTVLSGNIGRIDYAAMEVIARENSEVSFAETIFKTVL